MSSGKWIHLTESTGPFTTQKMKCFIKDFFSKCDQIRSFLRIWSHLLKKFLMENFIFCAVIPKKDFFTKKLLYLAKETIFYEWRKFSYMPWKISYTFRKN